MADTTPIVCTLDQRARGDRLDEFDALFRAACIGRDRRADRIRFRLAAAPGIEPWARDLAAREQQCCAFFDIAVSRVGDELQMSVGVRNPEASPMLDAFYALPDRADTTTGLTPTGAQGDRRGLGAVGAAGVACVAMCSAPALIAAVGIVLGSAAGGVAVAGAAVVVLTRKLRSRRNRFGLETDGSRGCSC